MADVGRGVAVVEVMGGDRLDMRPLMGGASTAANNMGVVTAARGGVTILLSS